MKVSLAYDLLHKYLIMKHLRRAAGRAAVTR
jgi:hypothetical protein